MTIQRIVLVALIALVSQFSIADTAGNYKFSGDAMARQVCKAVASDDLKKLKYLLRTHRNTLVYGYSFDLTGKAVAGEFQCNDMQLQEFSDYVGALKVSSFFVNDGDMSTGQVAATGN